MDKGFFCGEKYESMTMIKGVVEKYESMLLVRKY
jgi:hypothetical protein